MTNYPSSVDVSSRFFLQAGGTLGRNLFAQAVHEIGTRIVSGALRPGETLPKEQELGRELGISRSVMREAIKSLASKGLVESRSRVGTRIREPIYWNLLDPDVLAWRYRTMPPAEFFHSMYEVRRVIEPAAAGLAAEKASEADIAAIEKACRDMETADPTTDDAMVADLAFHRAILAACQNDVLLQMGTLIGVGLLTSFKIAQPAYDASLPMHRPVLEAIRARQPAQARSAMQTLLSRNLEFIERHLLRESTTLKERPVSELDKNESERQNSDS